MLADIFKVISVWLTTTGGIATVSLITVIGLILTVIFVFALSSLYSELTLERKTHQRNLAKTKSDHESEIVSFQEQLSSFRHANQLQQDELTTLNKQLGIEGRTVEDLNTALANSDERLRQSESREISLAQKLDIASDSISEATELAETRNFALRAIAPLNISLSSILCEVIGTKACQVKTIAFSFLSDPNSDVDDMPMRYLEVDYEVELKGDVFVPVTEAGLSMHENVTAYLIGDTEGKVVSPVYYAQVLYIRSLDRKIVLSDFITSDYHINVLAEHSVQMLKLDEAVAKTVRNTKLETLYLDHKNAKYLEDTVSEGLFGTSLTRLVEQEKRIRTVQIASAV